MLFNSLEFCVFFPVVTGLYFALPHRYRWALLLAASCLFYMAFVPSYILILGFTIVVDYFAGLLIAGSSGTRRKAWLAASIVANVGVLAFFKYWPFFAENVATLSRMLGSSSPLPALEIILPIGLSFHTFQAMSYTIEVYRGNQAPERHFGIYALYVMFYPQLVAGPIERPQNLLPQFHAEHRFDYERVVSGLQQMAFGMFKKVVIADRLAQAGAGTIWTNPAEHSGLVLLVSLVCFSFQIYLDFSAYSDIALGSARVMGFKLMTNFDTPYASRSVSEFWRRWHISLSTWFRDYLYHPLGGNRSHHFRNLMIVFLVSGLWHGAAWTFVAWGALHGLYLIAGKVVGDRIRMPAPLAIASTFALVSFAWIFFRAQGFGAALAFVEGLARIPSELARGVTEGLTLTNAARLAMIAAVVWLEAVHRRRSIWERLRSLPTPARHASYAAVIYATLFLAVPGDVQFIYFQF